MGYEDFRILFAEIERGEHLKLLSQDFDISVRTLERWRVKGFAKIRKSKYFYCDLCDEYSIIKHIHKSNYKNITNKDKKVSIIKKYNKKLAKLWLKLDN